MATPDEGGAGAAVEAELGVSPRQAEGQEVLTGSIMAIEQRPVRSVRPEDQLELHEGQIGARGLRPGDASV